jgi:hypothetical protein
MEPKQIFYLIFLLIMLPSSIYYIVTHKPKPREFGYFGLVASCSGQTLGWLGLFMSLFLIAALLRLIDV